MMSLATGRIAGSSPLARGTLDEIHSGDYGFGLIPARAGNTWPKQKTRAPARAHPRSRGEHRMNSGSAPVIAGSSPLARGTQEQAARLTVEPGLIPARAGNTGLSVLIWRSFGAHPRSRGEHR